MESERRIKVVRIPEGDILDWFVFGLGRYPKYICLPEISGVPLDAKVIAVIHDPFQGKFIFKVSHPTFPEAVPGAVLTDITGTTRMIALPLKPDADNPHIISGGDS